MNTKFILMEEIELAYIEKNPHQKQTVFFIHGNSGSSRTWGKQLQSDCFSNYRLIAFDLPGTGQSLINDTLNWDYSPIATGRILAEAVRQLSQDNPFTLVGFSYGTNVVAEMLNHDLTPTGIILCAVCVLGGDYTLDKVFAPGDSIFFHNELNENIVRSFFSTVLLSSTEEDVNLNTEDFFVAKPPFRSMLIQSIIAGKISDEISILKEQKLPLLVIFGSEDNALQIDYLDNAPFEIWRDQVIKLPKAGHYLHYDEPELFNQILEDYLKIRFSAYLYK